MCLSKNSGRNAMYSPDTRRQVYENAVVSSVPPLRVTVTLLTDVNAGLCPAKPLREEPCPTQGIRRAPKHWAKACGNSWQEVRAKDEALWAD